MYQFGKQHISVNQYFPGDQCLILQSYAWVKEFIQSTDRSMYFNATEFTVFTDMHFTSTFQFTFKKLIIVKFRCSVKDNSHSYLERWLKYSSIFQLYICEICFFLILIYFNQKTCYNRFGAGADMRIHLSSTKPGIKKICKKYKTLPLISFIFAWER